MNRFFKFIILLDVISFILISCSKVIISYDDKLIELNLQEPCIAIATETKTRPIDGTTFPWLSRSFETQTGGTQSTSYNIGLWICNKGDYTPHLGGQRNMSMTLTSSCVISTNVQSQTWSTKPNARLGQDIDVYSYYPYVNISVTEPNIPFTTSSQYDWMWAEPQQLIGISQENNKISLKYHHAMTCLEIRLCTTYTSTISLSSITLKDTESKLVTSGTMNITNGELSFKATSPQLTIRGNNSSNLLPVGPAYKSYCFLMPSKSFSEGQLSLSFSFDNIAGRQTFTIPKKFLKDEVEQFVDEFETGKKYIICLELDNNLCVKPLKIEQVDWSDVYVDVIL